MGSAMELALIDAIGPFFRNHPKRRINWSKIPFSFLPTEGPEAEACWEGIRQDLETFASRAAALGYNAATLDDVLHLSDHPWLEPEIRQRNAVFRAEFRKLFAILRSHGLGIYLTSDFLSVSPAVEARLRDRVDAAITWFTEVLEACLAEFPEIDGIILRIGESDGQDVKHDLRSRLYLRHTREANRLLRRILPVFERHRKRLIFRTWTVGIHFIGDLIWHHGRLASALKGIDSPALVLSMKYGESDFFRYLPVNRHFFRTDLPKIVEFQARREYEGAGEYPSFVGWDCEAYAHELAGAKNLIGFSVWCQTGGWHAFRRKAFLEPSALWIELNAAAIPRIMRGSTVEESVAAFFGPDRKAGALELLRLADIAVKELLYIEEFARKKFYFRRVRVPPLLHIYWDSLFINDAVRTVMSYWVLDPEQALRAGEAACSHFTRMQELARELKLPEEDIAFMKDTFALILLARRYYFLPEDPALLAEIKAAKKAYKARWPKSVRPRYRIRISTNPFFLTRRSAAWVIRLVIRDRRGYRPVLDHLFSLRVLSWIYRFFRARHEKAMPKFFRKTAMGIDSFFK
jgi:hypothetical protein